jgi:hypothetical protein
MLVNQAKIDHLHPGFQSTTKWTIRETYTMLEKEKLSRDFRLNIDLRKITPRVAVLKLNIFDTSRKLETLSSYGERTAREHEERYELLRKIHDLPSRTVFQKQKPDQVIYQILDSSDDSTFVPDEDLQEEEVGEDLQEEEEVDDKVPKFDRYLANATTDTTAPLFIAEEDDSLPKEGDFAPGRSESCKSSQDTSVELNQLPRPENFLSRFDSQDSDLSPLASSTMITLMEISTYEPGLYSITENMSTDLFPIDDNNKDQEDFRLPALGDWVNFQKEEQPILVVPVSPAETQDNRLNKMLADVSPDTDDFKLNRFCGNPQRYMFEESEGK